MDWTDIAIGAGGATGGLAVVGVAVRYTVPSLSRTLRHWIKGRAQSAQLRADIDLEREKSHLHAQDRFLDRIGEQDTKLDDLRREMEANRLADRAECKEQRQRDREECDRRVAAVEQRTSRLARRVAERWRLDAPFGDREDNTGLHEVDAIARSTPPLPPDEGRE